MHIAFLTSEFPPDFGGIATYIGHVVRMLTRGGHRVSVFAPGPSGADEVTGDGARVIRVVPHRRTAVPSLFRTLSHWPALSYQFADAVIDHFRSNSDAPDVIEVQEYGALGYYLLQRRLVDDTSGMRDTPILAHLHSPQSENLRVNQCPRYRFPDYWVGQMEKFCVNAADALLSPSHFLKEALVARGFTDQPIDVIPYPGCDPLVQQAEMGPPQGGDIAYFGRLEVRKGVLALAKACERLWSDGLDFRLTLIGGDTVYAPKRSTVRTFLRRQYRRFVESGHLTLSGPLQHEALIARLRSAWAVVVPSLHENYPYTCIEAMSAGRVVVASVSGGQAEMIGSNGQAGWLFDWTEPGSFERAMRSALGMTPEENRAMGDRGRQRIVALTSYDDVLPKRIEHYEKTIERAQEKRRSRLFPSVNWDLRPAREKPRPAQREIPNLLSVVIPYYNLGKYIDETLDGVLASSYRPLEVIIIDDGSDEPASRAALDRIRGRSPECVKVIRTDNRGLASARNTGADAARGEFLAFLDADDQVHPSFYERAVRVLQSFDNVGFVYSWVQYFGANNEWWPTWNTEFPYLLAHNMLVPIVVLRRDLFLSHARNRAAMEYNYEDWDAWVRLASAGYLGVSVPYRLVNYRVRRSSMYRRLGVEQSLYLHDLIAEGSPEVYRRYAVELFNLMNANGPHYLWVHPAIEAQHVRYHDLKAAFFWLASQPGMGWIYRLKVPLRRLYRWLFR